jgi:hypothetical protein
MSFFSYKYETRALILKEEHSLRVFENMVLRRLFGHKREEVTGAWTQLHTILISSQNIKRIIASMRVRQVGHMSRVGTIKTACEFQSDNLRAETTSET